MSESVVEKIYINEKFWVPEEEWLQNQATIANQKERIKALSDQLEKRTNDLNRTHANMARINSAAASLETVMIKVRDFCNQRYGHESIFNMTRDALVRYNHARDKQI